MFGARRRIGGTCHLRACLVHYAKSQASLGLYERMSYVPNSSLTIEQVLTILTETPPHIAVHTAGLVPAQLHTAPNHDEWSTNDVLAHLRVC